MHEVRYADWAGLRCEVRVMELEQLRVLLLVFLQSDFLDLVGEHPAGDDTTEVPVEEDGAIAVAEAFRDACGVLGPDVALILSSPKADLDGYVAEQEAAVLTGDVLALIKAGLGLLYLSAAYASDIDPILAPDQRDELPVEAGRLIFAGTGPHRWWG
jgi:hypothetical protein